MGSENLVGVPEGDPEGAAIKEIGRGYLPAWRGCPNRPGWYRLRASRRCRSRESPGCRVDTGTDPAAGCNIPPSSHFRRCDQPAIQTVSSRIVQRLADLFICSRLVGWLRTPMGIFPKNFRSLSATSRKSPTLEYPLTVSSLSASSSGRPMTSRIVSLPNGSPPAVGEDHPRPEFGRRQQLSCGTTLFTSPVGTPLRGNLPPVRVRSSAVPTPAMATRRTIPPSPWCNPASLRTLRISLFPRRCGCRTREPVRTRLRSRTR